ncbi:MAG: UDP-N-acetylmuramyl-tripeptide synthetase, partial [Pseudomonadota bacterium]
EFGYKLVAECQEKKGQCHTYSALPNTFYRNVPHVNVHQVHLDMHGITATIHTPWGSGVLHTSLLGRFNLTNLLAVMTTLNLLNIPFADVINIMAKLSTVNGRMQVLGGDNCPFVVVDYAHTPDALRQVLVSLRELTQNEIWCVFGCGGQRDSGKRPLMGQFAESLADHIILTNDNPRSEPVHKIIADILTGMLKPERVVIEYDRQRAISHAISCAAPQDVILVAGKGHERYQEIAGEKIDYNDIVEVQLQLKEIR